MYFFGLFIVVVAMIVIGYYMDKWKTYSLMEIKPRRKTYEEIFFNTYYIWQRKKLQLIKDYYHTGSYIRDDEWQGIFYITDVSQKNGFGEATLEYTVVKKMPLGKTVIEGIEIELYEGNMLIFCTLDYDKEIKYIYSLLDNGKENIKTKELLEKIYLMQGTNTILLDEVADLVKLLGENNFNVNIHKTKLYEMLEKVEKKYCFTTGITIKGEQINMAQDNGVINAFQNNNMSIKSDFAKRLDYLIEIMNSARENYEEKITLGYLCEFLGYVSENDLKKYYINNYEPDIQFMVDIAIKLGVNPKWLSKGTDEPIFLVNKYEHSLESILNREDFNIIKKIFLAIGKEGYGDCMFLMLKFNDIKYEFYNKSFAFHPYGGAGGQNELMSVYSFLSTIINMRNNEGMPIYEGDAYFIDCQPANYNSNRL